MKNLRFYTLATALALLLAAAVSCNKVEPSFNRENIKGGWVASAKDDNVIPVDDRLVYIFTDNVSLTICGAAHIGDGNKKWTVFDRNFYHVYCCELDMACTELRGIMGRTDTLDFRFHQVFDFPVHKTDYVELRSLEYTEEGVPADPGYKILKMNKLPLAFDKPDSLLGQWEFDNENLKDMMLSFAEGNKLEVYQKEKGEWALMSSEEDQYFVYGELLVLNVFDNAVLGQDGKWTVKCFQSLHASPYYGDMTMESGDLAYHLTKVTRIR